jgi:hydrogenase nickel incorporation protein HypB
MHRVKVRVVEDALDANNTIASANRADFDREGVTVLNLMSAPGAGKTTLLVKALPGLEGVRPGVLEGATSTRTWCAPRCPRCHWRTSTCS